MELFRPKICSCSIGSGFIKFSWDEIYSVDMTVESFAVVPEFTV